jgi:hypothetical protein
MFGLLFIPEDGGSMFLRNIHELPLDYTTAHPDTVPFNKGIILTCKVRKFFKCIKNP